MHQEGSCWKLPRDGQNIEERLCARECLMPGIKLTSKNDDFGDEDVSRENLGKL